MAREEDFRTYYEIKRHLGQSSFSIIYVGNKINTPITKAIKVYQKEKVNAFFENKFRRVPTNDELKTYVKSFENEATNMKILQGTDLKNKNAVILDDYFETDTEFAIIMEKCDNNIFNHLADRNVPFNSDEIYEILNQLNNSFKIMVVNKILHRAIKPQNIFLNYLDNDKTKYLVKLKITDDSCSVDDYNNLLDSNTVRNYRIYAPEILNDKNFKFTEKSDLWSLGVLIYTLYFKLFPFDGNSREEVLRNITEDTINKLEKGQNEDLNDLIRKLLIIEPTKRISWDKYFYHSFFKRRMDFTDFYDCKFEFIGSCTFANIYKGTDKNNGQQKAIKIMDRNLVRAQLRERYPNRTITEEDINLIIEGFFNEVNNMKTLQGKNNENQNTVIIDEYFYTIEEFIIIMELCDDNLLNYFIKEKKNKLSLEEIHDIISQLNNSFNIMDKNKILHRAIKPQNILLKYQNEKKTKFLAKLKLTDDSGLFRSSNELISQEIIDRNLKIYGPEVLEKRKFTKKSDLFSLGVLIYFLYFNEYPFKGEKKDEILKNIKNGINKELTKNPDFDDLLKKLLNGNERERISWEDYFKHKFFRINQDYTKHYENNKKILGESGYAIIYEAKDKKTNEMKAIKLIDKDTIKNYWKSHSRVIKNPTDEDLKPFFNGFFNEVNNMKILQGINNENQNTVILYDYFNTKENFAIVVELCDCNLIDYMNNKNLEFDEIKDILIQLNNSFKIMDKNKILHRAIKPENILIKKDKNSQKIIFKLKLTDNCCLLKDSSKIKMTTIILNNNLCISAPEVLNGEKFKEESDLWSLGILIYYLKFKNYPFIGNNKDEILSKIKTGLGNKLTDNSDFNDLVKKLLMKDSTKRMSWELYFNHPFLNKK